MRRDLPSIRQRHGVTSTSSGSFFFLVDAIAQQQIPTPTQLKELESSYQGTAKFLAERPEFEGLITEIHPHGSRQLGTIVRPWDDSREGFDIDLIAVLGEVAQNKYSGPRGPALLLSHFHTALEDYARAHQLTIKKWDRCVTLGYAGGMCADIAPVIHYPQLTAPYGATHSLIPDRSIARFESTNPLGFAKFFKDTAAINPLLPSLEVMATDSVKRAEIAPLRDPDEVFEPLLCRIVQVIKLHRNFNFGQQTGEENLAPSSAFITTLAAHAYAKCAPLRHMSPLDLLLDVVETMPTMFQVVHQGYCEEWQLPNPAALKSNLAEDMNTLGRQQAFREWIQRLVEDIDKILALIEARAGMDAVIDSIKTAFGNRPARAVENALLSKQLAERNAGRATLFTSSAAAVTLPSRSHNFFGIN